MLNHSSQMALGDDWSTLMHCIVSSIGDGTKNDCLPNPDSMYTFFHKAARRYMKKIGEPTYTRAIPLNCDMARYPLDCIGKLNKVIKIEYYDYPDCEEGMYYGSDRKEWQTLDPCLYYADIKKCMLNLHEAPRDDYCPNGLKITMSYYPKLDNCKMPAFLCSEDHLEALEHIIKEDLFLMKRAPWHDKSQASIHRAEWKSLLAKNTIRKNPTPVKKKRQKTSFWRI